LARVDGAPTERHRRDRGFLTLGGGVPIKVGDEVIGAVGVGGAPGGHLDEACAVAAIKQVEAKLK
jgi:uncharacterized protein GlcG (DUF336 family)